MKKILFILITIIISNSGYTQNIKYKTPKAITTDLVNLTFKKVKSTKSSYFINYDIKNLGNGILFLNRKNTSVFENSGEVRASKGDYKILPGKTKTIYNQFRVKSPLRANADFFDLKINGIKYAKSSNKTIKGGLIKVEEKIEKVFGGFTFKIIEYNVYTDRHYIQIKCTYNGKQTTIGKLDLTKIKVNGGNAKIIKKGDVIFPGKSYTFSINVTPKEAKLNVDCTDAIKILELKKIELNTIKIVNTNYKETSKKENKKNDSVVKTQKPCELSYSKFTTLKNTIKKQMDIGNKAVETAQSFLKKNKCITTLQVIELMGIFNLDGSKLEFAKMAYKYTSDKGKYHKAVGKLSYVKNKEALEEFLNQ
ncbi:MULTISPECIES: DUF4476 domain-containing protein [unclassified Tenacibaculum]|uniref:DUF4476 domain-containing protein n=1 Tax=unclassified Tenacibaculum TaxID=2635139 RepID=UPI001F3660EB|nr:MULTISPECIES: DUF4476 domain-containing protein [unclassified Tenacibaculum]MCF2874481.1 DUF4476 domain-containing protein [Tenacibaculum sp. Cn5-1]MCF2934453.1 DUF4476 domain-containing protein [Tenacibaculum sp. Cn5-34]MCG7510663.1 DUF4476 domain-containing protein [Tenacibaculum sp. Cn5-46]